MSSFGERFKRIRVSKGLTQEELADDFNKQYGYALTKATITHYETNRRIPEMNTIRKFADYFTVSLDYLLCNDIGVVKEGASSYLNIGTGKYIELNEIVMLIKSLCDDKLIINNNEVISEEQRKILCNGIDVVIGIVNSIENKS